MSGSGDFRLPGVSLTDPEILARPNAFYRALRTEDPVHYDEKLGMRLVSRYEDIVALLRDPETFSDKQGYEAQYASGYFEEFRQILEREGGGFFPDVIKSDPPEHTRIRKLMDGAFSAHRVKTLEPAIKRVIVEQVERIADKADRGEAVDGVNDFAVPLTIASSASSWESATTTRTRSSAGRVRSRRTAIPPYTAAEEANTKRLQSKSRQSRARVSAAARLRR